MNPGEFVRIIKGKRYSTKTATLIAHDNNWDGHNMDHNGRNTFLYRTPSGVYFFVRLTRWQGEEDTIEPCDITEAQDFYEGASWVTHCEDYKIAFPMITIVDA